MTDTSTATSMSALRQAFARIIPGGDLISLPYLLLRVTTAATAFAMGFVQTFVLARVLTPERFSIFIVVGAIGYTLWLTDLGLAKILFVNLRASHLRGRTDEQVARQATAVILFYVSLALAASLVCFAVNIAHPAASFREAIQLALFMLYITLNLAWFSLRTLSISVDLFVFYERLEVTRRVVIIAMMLSMLAGVPFTAFLIGANILWCTLLGAASAKLIARGAMVPHGRGVVADLVSFFRMHKESILRSGTGAFSGVFVATSPYYFVSLVYGLGSAPIILEVTMRIFRGGSVIYTAATDLAIPGQTRALAQGDARKLVRTTLFAVSLCCIPAFFACVVLMTYGGPFFRLLLKSAATVPPAIAPILVVLMLSNVVQMVSESLLQHTGYFRSYGRINALIAAILIAIMALTFVAKFDIVDFLAAYAGMYLLSAILSAAAVVWGPIRSAAAHPANAAAATDGMVRALRSVLPAPRATPTPQHTAHRTPQPSQSP